MKRSISLAFLAPALLASAASPAHAEVIEKNERGFVTRDTAEVTASPRETWLALISPGKWWNSSHTWSGESSNMTLMPQAGGCFCEKLPGNDTAENIALSGSVEHMTVILALPDQVLRMRGGLGPLQSEPVDGVLTVTMRATEGGTRILWEYAVGGYHRFEQDMIATAVDGVMSEQLSGLANHLGKVEVEEEEENPQTSEAGEKEGEGEEAGAEEAQRPSVEEAFEGID